MTNRCGEASPSFSFEEVGVKLEAVESVCPDGFPLDLPGGQADVVQEFIEEGGGMKQTSVEQEVAAKAVLAPISEDKEEEDLFKERGSRGSSSGSVQNGGKSESQEHHDDDGAVHFGSGHEGRELKLPSGVPVPSKDMIRKHRKAGHCPYRPWCAHCVAGAANAPPHLARAPVESDGTPEMHCDYAFFRDKPGDKENTVTVLVGKDRFSSGIAADVAPKKGAGAGYAVKQLDRNLKKFGNHGKVVLRSDGEVAIKDLLQKVSEMRASQTLIESTPKGDSRANGRAERAAQQVEKQTRVLKLAGGEELGTFSVRHPCFTWLVHHAADVYNKYHVGPDGRTVYERLKGRPYSGTMFEFGQVILYKTSSKVQGGDMSAGWKKGIWLGKRFTTEEHLIATTDGLVAMSGAVREHPGVTWDSKMFDSVVGVPWDPLAKNRGQDASERHERVADLPRVLVTRGNEEIPLVRNFALTKIIF